jgi:murein DD-endopeptidase MepM/ murein hydrolase activator NlpD
MEKRQQPRVAWALVAATAALLAVAVLPSAAAQVAPLDGSTTTTTSPPPAEPAPAPAPSSEPSGDDLSSGADQAPAGAKDPGGDGAPAPAWGVKVPPEAQRIINSVARTGASSNDGLLAALAPLREMGLPEAEALRVGLGRFPIAGPARYSHDWLYPRYGPGFRFHLGTDVFAAAGTPVRAPVDGIAKSANGGLGGLTVKVVMADGTYFYLAHLSGLAEGFVNGMAVRTGDIVGYVGDSGNARGGAPHLHIGIYPNGGPPIDPKPVLDQFLAEAQARLPEVVAAYAAARPAAEQAPLPASAAATPASRPARLGALSLGGAVVPAEVLYAAGANPVRGPRGLVDLALQDLVSGIDWAARASEP